jgi:acyl-CoA synthetase (AMP-forming)/AMP-acid ligase II
MSDPAAIAAEVRAELTGPGGRWETVVEDVLGESCRVYADRHPNLRARLVDQVERYRDRACLVIDDTTITYGELLDRVAATAARLADEYGVSKGDRVAILAANCPEWVIAFYASTSLGAVVAALNGWWTAPEIEHGLAVSDPSLLIGDTKRLARADGLPEGLPVLDLDERPDFFAPGDAALPDVELAEDDPALILFTSGTTGRAKGATVSHRGLVGFVDVIQHNAEEKKLAALRFMGIDPDELPPSPPAVYLNTAPLFHVSGLPAGILNTMEEGATIVFRRGRFDPADVLRLIERHGITNWTAPGDTAQRVMRHPDFATTDTSSVARIGTGGAHFTEALRAEMAEHFPQAAASMGQGYGSSETVGVVATTGGPEFKENPDTTGAPNHHFDVEIRDPFGTALPEGAEGEIHVRSAYTMLGYWGNPEATAGAIGPGRWLATGDIGRLERGMLFVNSRARDMILHQGENVYPTEVEGRLDQHPDVAESAVYGVDHPDRGQDVKAVVVPIAGRSPDTEELRAFCAEGLAGYKVPTVWEFRTEPLPRTAAGKVIKGVLRGDQELSQTEE